MELVVARIGRPQGLRGEVSVEVRTDDPSRRFVVGAELRTDPAGAGPLTLASVRDQSGRTILRFAGVEDRAAAEGLRGVLLVIDADEGTDAGSRTSGRTADEWYDHELVGLRAERVDGQLLGTITRVDHGPAQDLLVVRPEPGAATPAAGTEVLVPFVAALVPDVDVAAGRVLIDPPGGLFDPVED
jgi:16S rRNA processing protein RimM